MKEDIKEPIEKVEEPKQPEEVKKDEKVDEKVEDKAEEPKKEEKKPEEPKKEEPEVDVLALKKELSEANKKAKEVDVLNNKIEQMIKDSEVKDQTIKAYEDLISKMVEVKMEQVPADYKELIPDNLDIIQKLSWLEKAESKGLFNKEEKKKPAVEIGKPMNVDAPQVDTNKLSASQLLKLAYSTVKK